MERLGTRELDFMRRHRLVSCFPADGTPGHWRQKEEPVTDVRPQNAFAQYAESCIIMALSSR